MKNNNPLIDKPEEKYKERKNRELEQF